MAIPRPLYLLMRFVIDICVVTAIILLVPGVPPNVKFESYDVTPPMDLVGPLSRNSKLDSAELLFYGKFTGPESIATRNGEVYTGIIGGDVIKIKDGQVTVVARFGNECEGKWQESICGRPLGMKFDSKGNLIVADAYYGIFSVNVDTGKVETLVSANTKIDGRPPMIFNDLSIAKDGTIYFSDSSHVHLQDAMIEFFGEATGRLIKYDPATKKSSVLLNKLHFANGVQLSSDESYVLVAETARSRIQRYYLKGPKAGQSDIFIDGLPGTPDNLTPYKGGFIISNLAIKYPNSLLDKAAKLPLVRKFVLRVTTVLQSTISFIDSLMPNEYTGKVKYYINHLEPAAIAFVPKESVIVLVDENGRVKGSLQSLNGKVHHISEMTIDEKGEFAYFGSPYNQGIWRLSLKDLNLK